METRKVKIGDRVNLPFWGISKAATITKKEGEQFYCAWEIGNGGQWLTEKQISKQSEYALNFEQEKPLPSTEEAAEPKSDDTVLRSCESCGDKFDWDSMIEGEDSQMFCVGCHDVLKEVPEFMGKIGSDKPNTIDDMVARANKDFSPSIEPDKEAKPRKPVKKFINLIKSIQRYDVTIAVNHRDSEYVDEIPVSNGQYVKWSDIQSIFDKFQPQKSQP